jgi:hypothetical protein
MSEAVKSWICTTCGTQFAPSVKPPHSCPICQDERQFVNWDGQEWTTLAQLQRSHQNLVKAQGPGITGIANFASKSAPSRILGCARRFVSKVRAQQEKPWAIINCA